MTTIMSDQDYIDNYDDMTGFALSAEQEANLLAKQTECTFMWTNTAGEPVGLIMNYVWRDGRFWLTATRSRARVPAIEKRPRVAVCLSSRGTSIRHCQALTFKGTAIVHDDEETKDWFYTELSNALRPTSAEQAAAFYEGMASTSDRVVIEVLPDKKISFDTEPLFRGSPAGPALSRLD
jgi:general stress protein 26